MKLLSSIFLLLLINITSCKKETPVTDIIPPQILSTSPSDGAVNVPVTTQIEIEYDEDILLSYTNNITVNGIQKIAVRSERKIIIQSFLVANRNYNVTISSNSVKDKEGNFCPEYSFSFTTENASSLLFEAEYAKLSTGLSVQTSTSGYSGPGYVGSFTTSNDSLVFELDDIQQGRYDLNVSYITSGGDKVCTISVNGASGGLSLPNAVTFSRIRYGTVKMANGKNKIKISPNWTYFAIDYIQIVRNTDPIGPFSIDANLVTPGPSVQAVNVYNYLKDNFQTKIISGTMAAHSTNIDEATWVHDQTGKWPALTGFDFIDHTWSDQNWVEYNAPFTLGNDWWSNNGLITISWHWRDPLTKNGSFYTSETTFDVERVSDPNSDEYKAMIVDMDTIAGYLREFRDANIPVIWRPLHEAAGGWFWWGAKGAEPCKTLWQLMFDRLVNYHGLNNLIWVWTTNTASDAIDWYPGDTYVDIIGMDIYPGENQHGSQYIEFDKAKELFGGKKIITLSECGSVPDPALMMAYGDTWSWFMPWNGDFTRSDLHNGAQWWDTFFNYDYVITRDMMPDLK